MSAAYTIRVESGPHHSRADRVFVTAGPSNRPVVTLNVRHYDGQVSWASDWGVIPDLQAAGIIRYEHLGPGTYGHTNCYLV